MSKNKFIIIAAPSGSGKSSIVNMLLNDNNLKLNFSTSATTRPKRDNEVDGKNYLGKLKGVDENGMGEFEWQDENHPPKKLHSSEVKWIFGLHSL